MLGNPARKMLLLLPLLFFLLDGASPLLAEEKAAVAPPVREYSFGSFPFLAQPTLEGIFSPLAAELSAALARPIHYESSANFEKFTDNLAQEQYDIAHIHPFDYVAIAAKAGYLPLVTRTEMLSALFVVKAESPLKNGQDLRGKKIGLPPKVATVSYLARLALLQAGIKPEMDVALRHFNTHQSCLQALLIGDIDACAVGPPVLRIFEAETQRQLRVILTSPEIPQTLFVVHQRVPPAEREIIQMTLLATRLQGVDPKLRKLFIPEAAAKGAYFRAVTDKEYDIVRSYLKMMTEK